MVSYVLQRRVGLYAKRQILRGFEPWLQAYSVSLILFLHTLSTFRYLLERFRCLLLQLSHNEITGFLLLEKLFFFSELRH